VVPGLDRRAYGRAPPSDWRSTARTEPVQRGPWRARGQDDSNGLGARRMGERTSAGGRPWAARGADAEACRHVGAVASEPQCVASPLFKIEKLQNLV
jgi:hypothetical protein